MADGLLPAAIDIFAGQSARFSAVRRHLGRLPAWCQKGFFPLAFREVGHRLANWNRETMDAIIEISECWQYLRTPWIAFSGTSIQSTDFKLSLNCKNGN